MLLDIKKYLQEKSNANIIELARHCRVAPETMRELLAYWEKRGKIKEFFKPNVCGSTCIKCKPEFAKMYEWCDSVVPAVGAGLVPARGDRAAEA